METNIRKYGYVNPASVDYGEHSRLRLLEHGIPENNIFLEKSKGNHKRQTLNSLVNLCNPNDIIYCISLTEISNSVRHFILFFEKLRKNNIKIVVLDNPVIDTTNEEYSDQVIKVLQTLYSFNSSIMGINSVKSLQELKKKGVKLGRPRGLSDKAMATALKAYQLYHVENLEATIIAEQLGVSKNTFYKYVKIIKAQKDSNK